MKLTERMCNRNFCERHANPASQIQEKKFFFCFLLVSIDCLKFSGKLVIEKNDGQYFSSFPDLYPLQY